MVRNFTAEEKSEKFMAVRLPTFGVDFYEGEDAEGASALGHEGCLHEERTWENIFYSIIYCLGLAARYLHPHIKLELFYEKFTSLMSVLSFVSSTWWNGIKHLRIFCPFTDFNQIIDNSKIDILWDGRTLVSFSFFRSYKMSSISFPSSFCFPQNAKLLMEDKKLCAALKDDLMGRKIADCFTDKMKEKSFSLPSRKCGERVWVSLLLVSDFEGNLCNESDEKEEEVNLN